MQCTTGSVILSLFLLLMVSTSALDLNLDAVESEDLPSLHPVPDQPVAQAHQLSKRQSSSACLLFFLQEPPRSLQCLPQRDNLTLTCTVLASQLINRQIPLTTGWFFSLDGVEAQLVQVSRFNMQNAVVAYRNVLEVLNPLPGAYFCSAALAGQIFDSRVLRVEEQVLRTVCQPGQLPTLLQPSTPRCATRGGRINLNTLNPPTVATTNTINLGGGVPIPSPTYNIDILRTMEIPDDIITATPSPATPLFATPSITPPSAPPPGPIPVAQQSPGVAIGVGVAVAVLVLLVTLILALILGAVWFVKKRERNQLTPKAGRSGIFERFSLQPSANRVPLLPPARPPPVLNEADSQQEEGIYTAPDTTPLPYEEVQNTIPRYSGERIVKKIPEDKGKFPNVLPKASPAKSQEGKKESYYARPKFHRPGILSSTSTHIYGDLRIDTAEEVDSLYISSRQLEPFHQKKNHQVTEKELMLGDIEETADQESDTSIQSGSEEGSLSDEFGQEGVNSVENNPEEPGSWVDASPTTGQTNPSTDLEPTYINTQHRPPPLEVSELLPGFTMDEVKYVNTRAAASAAVASIKDLKVKTAPDSARKKQRKKMRRNKTTPSSNRPQEEEEDQYIGLTLETANYTSIYTSAHRNSTAEEAGN